MNYTDKIFKPQLTMKNNVRNLVRDLKKSGVKASKADDSETSSDYEFRMFVYNGGHRNRQLC